METLDFTKNYSHPKFKGVALWIAGYPKVWVPDTYTAMDEYGNEYEDETGTGEMVDDTESGRVLVVMVGDDYKNTVDVSDLTVISDDDFCDGCGQIGCGHSSKREE